MPLNTGLRVRLFDSEAAVHYIHIRGVFSCQTVSSMSIQWLAAAAVINYYQPQSELSFQLREDLKLINRSRFCSTPIQAVSFVFTIIAVQCWVELCAVFHGIFTYALVIMQIISYELKQSTGACANKNAQSKAVTHHALLYLALANVRNIALEPIHVRSIAAYSISLLFASVILPLRIWPSFANAGTLGRFVQPTWFGCIIIHFLICAQHDNGAFHPKKAKLCV